MVAVHCGHVDVPDVHCLRVTITDRKSTRLNSSHLGISYAVFCLKKKTGQVPKTPSPSGRGRREGRAPGGRQASGATTNSDRTQRTLPKADVNRGQRTGPRTCPEA